MRLHQCLQRDNANEVATKIPNIIHQTWKTANISTYPTTSSYGTWKTIFEPLNYTVKLWTDESIRQLISQRYDWLLPIYDAYPQNIQRADLARLVVVYHEGGIYADLDLHPKKVEELICLQSFGSEVIFAPTSGSLGPSNHFFMAERGSRYLRLTIEEAYRRSASAMWIPLPYLQVFWSTGPLLLGATTEKYLRWREEQARLTLLREDFTKSIRTILRYAI
ncbi:Inositol phosphoceramide mannosyltransferase 2 [Paramyrothecium foliicola]|nr:Inositol phosphoceramide mannosyltransferase 2 [Paramyrothecium foliicola]